MTITVIVDDSDPEIVYGGAWTKIQASALSSSGIKQSIGNTLHSSEGNIETGLSYDFFGSMISVFAVMMPDVVNTATLPYSWGCNVDGSPSTPLAVQQLSVPTTIKICEITDLTDSPHQLNFYVGFRLNDPIIFPNQTLSGAIYFDYIEYLPTKSTTAQIFSFIAVSFDDEALIYDGYDGIWATMTLVDGTTGMTCGACFPRATVRLQFNGSSVTWIGFLEPGSDAVATYTIDDQPHVQFALPQYANNKSTVTQPGRVFFESTGLTTAAHNISLAYSPPDTGNWQPMSVQSVIIGNGTVPALITNTTVVPSAPTNTTVVPSAPTNTSLSPHSTTTKPQETTHSLRPGPIIAGVLSGAFIIVFIITLVILRRRRRQTQRKHPHVIQAFSSQPSPLLARLITFPSVTTINIKGRRQLLPAPVPPGVIPPSKLTPGPTDTSTQAPNEQDPVQPPTENAQAEGDVDNVRDLPVRVTRTRDIQEEDSGLRLVEQGADGEEEIIRVLPPVYTAI